MNHRTIALCFLLASAPPSSLRAAETAPAAAPKKTLALVLMTFAQGDKQVAELFKGTLEETQRIKISNRAGNTDFLGKLEISRNPRGTTLTLNVFAKGGALFVRSQRVVSNTDSVIDAAQAMSREVAGACSGEPVAPSVVIPGAVREAAPEPEVEPIPDRPPRPIPAGQDWTGEEKHFSEPKPRHLDFLAGVELGFGPWSADSSKIVAGSSGFDLNHYAQAFTRTLDERWHPALDVHGGWKFLNFGAIEAAFQSSAWTGPGGAILAGARVSFFPLQAFLPQRKIDLGIELGYGYAYVSGGSYDMSGGYFTFGLTGEYPINDWMGITLFYRLFTPFLSNFYVGDKSGSTQPVQGFTADWNTFGIGLNWHFTKSW